MVKNQNKENNPNSAISSQKPPKLPKPSLVVPEIKNSFYENLTKLEAKLEVNVFEGIEIPDGFFSPLKQRARSPLRQM